MKTTRHSLLAKGLLVLLSLLIMIFVFTYSWFRDPSEPVTATGLVLNTRNTSTDFDYSVGFSTSQTGYQYKHTAFTNDASIELDLTNLPPSDGSSNVNLLYDYNPTDITGDGVTLVRPAMNYGNWSINMASRNYSIAVDNEQYISFDLIFRTHVPGTVMRLDPDSYAKAACETYTGDGSLVGASSGNDGSALNYNDLTDPNNSSSNKYGRFSRDAVVGAVRVAFLNYEENDGSTITAESIIDQDLVKEGTAHYADTPALLWIPRPDLYLDNNPNNAGTTHEKDTYGWELKRNVASGTTFNLQSESQTNSHYSTYTHQFYNIFSDTVTSNNNVTPEIVSMSGDNVKASVLNTEAGSTENKVTLGTSANFLSLDYHYDEDNDGVVDPDEYYYGKVRVRIWLEGTDSESRRALAGGRFSVNFHITG